MKTSGRGDHLVQEMLADPVHFDGNQLLQEYFAGLPLETLQPLLLNSDHAVRRVAVWIASELGKQARPLIDSATTLVGDEDPYIRFYALEVIAVCSSAQDACKYVYVVRSLEDRHDYTRGHVMFLMSNGDDSQLAAAMRELRLDDPSSQLHRRGLSELLACRRAAESKPLLDMINSPEPLLRKYGAIAAWRCRVELPDLFPILAESDDADLQAFWKKRSPK